MKFLNLEALADFVCAGSECPFTCCGNGWKIFIDEETDKYYRSVSGEMGERLSRSTHRENGKSCFTLDENDNCPFLNDRGLCDIYIKLGEEHLSNTCTYYPRYMFYSGDIRFAGVSISCPEVARFFMSHKAPLLMDFGEDELPSPSEADIDWKLFNSAIRVFTSAVEIAQNRDLNINERIALIVIFINEYQSKIDNGEDTGTTIDLFSDPSTYDQLLPQTGIYIRDYESKMRFVSEFIGCYRNINGYEKMFPELPKIIEFFSDPDNATISNEQLEYAFKWLDCEESGIWLEQIFVYTIFRYFMQGFSNKDFYDKLMVGLILVYSVFTILLSLLCIQYGAYAGIEDGILLISHISRLIEHDPNAQGMALRYFKEKGITDMQFVLKLIS